MQVLYLYSLQKVIISHLLHDWHKYKIIVLKIPKINVCLFVFCQPEKPYHFSGFFFFLAQSAMSAHSLWLRIPVSQGFCLLYACVLAYTLFTLSSPRVFLWKWKVPYTYYVALLWFLVSCWMHWLLYSRVSWVESNAVFISKGRLVRIQWLGSICLWILST